MDFPIVPLPLFVEEMFPISTEMHHYLALIPSAMFGLLGLVYIVLWVPIAKEMGQEAVGMIRIGYYFLMVALGLLLFGLYMAIVLTVLLLMYILDDLFRGDEVVS